MNALIKPAIYIIILSSSFAFTPGNKSEKQSDQVMVKKPQPKIQVAVLLDVSNSMDGLINQAKAQLWNMVSVMGKAKCDEATPIIEIALYEYGRTSNNPNEGYVKQINAFTNDLDQVSRNLFSLTTMGGDEYCGHVMYKSLTQMNWDTLTQSYKVIFIAGNEDFLQGDVSFTKACDEARKKNVVINTIYCGSKNQGIQEHWNLGSECGIGSFTNINSDATIEDIPTPYDSTLFVLNNQLNSTYMAYGDVGVYGYSSQIYADSINYKLNKSAAAKRVSVKGQAELYQNTGWDLVDARKADKDFIKNLDKKNLPDSLRIKSVADLEKIVAAKDLERQNIQKEIGVLSVKRENYLSEERAKAAKNRNSNNVQTLESEIEKIIRQQAARVNMVIGQ